MGIAYRCGRSNVGYNCLYMVSVLGLIGLRLGSPRSNLSTKMRHRFTGL